MHIIITGASRGVGYELVKMFAKSDHNTIYALSRNKSKLDSLADECKLLNNKSFVNVVSIDLSSESEIKAFAQQLTREKITIDILINNAGLLINKPFEKIELNDIESIYKVNVFAPMMLTQNIIPLIKQSTIAHIINISSMGGFQGSVKFPGLTAYSSSKAAIANLTECLAEEYKETNIKVNCLALGAVATEMLAEAFPGYDAPVSATQMAEYIYHFAVAQPLMYNGKVLPVSCSTP